MNDNLIKKGKYLALLLRHKPENANLDIDEYGWVKIDQIISNTNIIRKELKDIVESNDKKRYSISDDKEFIRAVQGHSIPVKVNLRVAVPPILLYHGTSEKNVNSIRKKGINSGSRLHVHLSKDIETATLVAKRHGKPYIFILDTKQMYKDGIEFYISENDVWLTDFVDKKYLK